MSQVALVVGVGPGLGWNLTRRFVDGGMHVAMVARDSARLEGYVSERPEWSLSAHGCDATDAGDVDKLFRSVEAEFGSPEVVIFNAGAFKPARMTELSPEDFERCWRIGCFGGFLVGREAAVRMEAAGQGTIIFTGATASLRGGPKFANLAVPKFGLRALAQTMARELGPQGVHVAHVIIDGQIRSAKYEYRLEETGPDSLLEPEAIAEQYWQLHQQHRSAWTQELDLRPWVEKF